jgi:hypothetical protein
MKRTIFALLATALLIGVCGCTGPHGRGLSGLFHGSCQNAPENCAACDDDCDGSSRCRLCHGRGCDGCRGRHDRGQDVADGPATGAVTYPYYTLRGPRDFLARNPRDVGP